MHINVGLDTLLILAGLLTPANVNDTVVADQLLTGLERYVPPARVFYVRASPQGAGSIDRVPADD